jgi:hypothetical protein
MPNMFFLTFPKDDPTIYAIPMGQIMNMGLNNMKHISVYDAGWICQAFNTISVHVYKPNSNCTGNDFPAYRQENPYPKLQESLQVYAMWIPDNCLYVFNRRTTANGVILYYVNNVERLALRLKGGNTGWQIETTDANGNKVRRFRTQAEWLSLIKERTVQCERVGML